MQKISFFKNFVLDLLFSKYIKYSVSKNYLEKSENNLINNKIIFIIPTLGTGGAERQLVNLINWLLNFGNYSDNTKLIICLLSSEYDSDIFFRSELNKNIQIISLKRYVKTNYFKEVLNNPKLFWLGTNLKNFEALNNIISRERPSTIHAWLDLPGILAGMLGLRNSNSKIIISTRSLNPTNFALSKFYFKSALQTLANSPQVVLLNNSFTGARNYESWLGLQSNTIRVIHNGYNLKFFTDKKLIDNTNLSPKFVIGGVMRFVWEKDLDLWLAVAKSINESGLDVDFKIIGSGPNGFRVNSKLSRMNLKQKVEIIHPRTSIYSTMSRFNILLSTSRIEGLPNVIIEAQLLGIPVVATNAGGSCEAFIDGESGYLVDSRNPNKISQVIGNLIINNELKEKFSQNAVLQATSKFNIDTIGHKYLDLYNHVQ